MENKEDILDALNEFDKKLNCTESEIPPLLEQYLQQVAKTGKTWFPWAKLKKLFVSKVDQVMTAFKKDGPADLIQSTPNVDLVKFEDMRKRILALMDDFQGAPFTVQRLCELLIEPKRHYKRSDKFLRGIEKNVSVVSTVDPFGRKIVSESQAMVNGLDSNGFNETLSKPNPFTSFPTPTQSAWTASIDKWFGTGTSNLDQNNSTDNEELSEEKSKQAEISSEQKDIEGMESSEMETSGTSSSDGDSNDEDVFTNSISTSDEKIESSHVAKSENTSQEEKPELTKETSSEEKPENSIRQEPEHEVNEISETFPSNVDTDEHHIDTPEQPCETSTALSETSEQNSKSCENTAIESTRCENEQTSDTQISQASDICKNAQDILDSVNKTCSEAEETFNIAHQLCDSDKKEHTAESEDEQSSLTEQSSDNSVKESSESSSEQSKESFEEQSSESTVEKTQENSVENSPENLEVQSSLQSEELSKENSIQHDQQSTNNVHKSVESSGSEDQSNLPQQESEGSETNTDSVQDPSSSTDTTESVSDAKKPRLDFSETCQSESMDVDSNEYSDSSSPALISSDLTSNVSHCSSEAQGESNSPVQEESSEDIPMEQD